MRDGARRVILQAPTGSGKSVMIAEMIRGTQERGKVCWLLCHRRELLDQLSDTLRTAGVEHGWYAAGKPEGESRVMLASVQTLVRRLDTVETWPDLIAVDECHHATSPTYTTILAAAEEKKPWVIGLTATPSRTDGRALGDQFDAIVPGPSVSSLTDRGHLAPYRIIGPEKAINPRVSKRGGDYAVGELEEWLTGKKIIGDAVKTYQKYVEPKSCLVYCVSRAYARRVAAAYREAGVRAEYVAGDTHPTERAESIQMFRDGKLPVIVSVDLFGEGLDCPGLQAVQLLRPTASLGLHLQQVGRALRPEEGKEHAFILDHVGNSWRHGLPDDSRTWTLAGRQATARVSPGEVAINLAHCRGCHAVFQRGPSNCPACGAIIPALKPEPAQEEGRMVELKREQIAQRKEAEKKRKQAEVGRARTLEELVRIAVDRGYRLGWAANIHAARRRGKAHFFIHEEMKIRKEMF